MVPDEYIKSSFGRTGVKRPSATLRWRKDATFLIGRACQIEQQD